MHHVPQEAVEKLPHDSLLQIEELTQVHVLPSIEFRRLGDHHPLSGFNVFSYASKFSFIFLAKFVINALWATYTFSGGKALPAIRDHHARAWHVSCIT